jgi:hypothetical protein
MDISRRSLLALMALPLPAASVPLDHLLLGVSDLDKGVDWVRLKTGVTGAIGGSHPGRGTRNALLSLANDHYLEIIAPDPTQSEYHFHVDIRSLTEPRLVNWAARTRDIEATAKLAREAGYHVTGPLPGSRVTAAGATLHWKSLTIEHPFATASVDRVPFFIEWSAGTAHPSTTAPSGCTFESLRLEHPQAEALASMLRKLRIEVEVKTAPASRITAALQTPAGRVVLS